MKHLKNVSVADSMIRLYWKELTGPEMPQIVDYNALRDLAIKWCLNMSTQSFI